MSAGPATAEAIFLRNGGVIHGRIIGQTRENVRIRRHDGRVRVISKRKIRRIDFQAKKPPVKTVRKPTRPQPVRKPARKTARKKTTTAAYARPVPPASPGGIPWAMVGRSALLPGWGQWERNRRGTALGFAASFGILTAGALSLRANYANRARALGDLNNPFAGALFLPAENFTGAGTEAALAYTSIFQTEQNRVDAAFRRSRNANLLLALVYLANLVHAAWAPKATLTPGERPGPIFSVSTSRVDTFAGREGPAGEQLEFRWLARF